MRTARPVRGAAALSALLMLLALALMLPRPARADSVPVDTTQSLHFSSYNLCGNECPLKNGTSDSKTARTQDVLDEASASGWNADGIFLQEVCADQYNTLNAGLQPLGYHGMFTQTVRAGTPKVCGGGYAYGLALFVKGTVVDSTSLVLTSGDEVEPIIVPCIEANIRGQVLWGCSVHLYWVADPTLNQLEAVKLAAQVAAWEDAGIPVVLGGDFNALPRTTSMSDFYSPSADDGGHGRFVEADETDKSYFNQQVCDPVARLYCRSGETTYNDDSSGGTAKIDYLLFSERYFRDAVGDALPRDRSVSDHQIFRAAVSPARMSNLVGVGDQNGDGVSDAVAVERSTGALYRYLGPGFAGGTRVKIGSGWNVYDTLVGVGDLTGDGVPDLLAVDGEGRLFRYSGPGFTGSSKAQIGTGWNSMGGISAVGDLTGDGVPDLVAVERSSGDLYRYPGPGFAGGSRVRIGTGWNIYHTLVGAGDLTGDGVPDLLAVDGSGGLFRYSGPGFTGSSKVQTGNGWNSMAELSVAGDLTGDGVPDLLAVDAAGGDLYRYSGPGFGGGSRVLIGNGW
jgi:endonuclease/exonuclease/phosphatase family metal-dependent hydrolase